jgi:hypothetical protein
MTDHRKTNASNLLANPGFEEADENGFAGWGMEMSEGMYYRRESDGHRIYSSYWPLDVHGGGDAIRIAGLVGGEARLSQEIDVTGGRGYEASVWVKTYDAAGQGFGAQPGDMAGIEIEFVDKAGKVVSRRLVASTARATRRYARVRGRIKAPENAARVRFALVVKIGCNHWHGCVRFDDCVLEETA